MCWLAFKECPQNQPTGTKGSGKTEKAITGNWTWVCMLVHVYAQAQMYVFV